MLNGCRPFRDAGIGPSDFPLTVIDVLDGLEFGINNGWVNSLERSRDLSNFECNWVVPGHILACASPSSTVSS